MLHPDRLAEASMAAVLVDLLEQAGRENLRLPLPSDPLAIALARRVLDAPADPASMADLARHAGGSLRTMQRLFARETGLTFQDWRRQLRLLDAASRLAGGVNVMTIALDCGYTSLSAFSAAFRRQFGVSPLQYHRASKPDDPDPDAQRA